MIGILEPISPVPPFEVGLDELADQLFNGALAPGGRGAAYPELNVWEEGDDVYVEAEMPGLGIGDVEVTLTGTEVTIRGTRHLPEEKGTSWLRRERPEGVFMRTLGLPWEVQSDAVQATLHDGVLLVRLPKSQRCRRNVVKVQAT